MTGKLTAFPNQKKMAFAHFGTRVFRRLDVLTHEYEVLLPFENKRLDRILLALPEI